MELVHHSYKPAIGPITRIGQSDQMKPRGLWVSDDSCPDNWRAWCESEKFRLPDLAFTFDVKLVPEAPVLLLHSASEIDAFTAEWFDPSINLGLSSKLFMPWGRIAEAYAGLIITPYIWSRRLEGGADWYFTWDCASGCIWEPTAIASIELRV